MPDWLRRRVSAVPGLAPRRRALAGFSKPQRARRRALVIWIIRLARGLGVLR